MKKLLACAAVVASLVAAPVFADEVTGTIASFDAAKNVIVMTDHTVWELGPDLQVPAGLTAGDRVTLVFTSAGEAGVTGMISVNRAGVSPEAATKTGG